MDSKKRQAVEGIFEAALDRPRAEWAAFLSDECGGDSELRGEIEALLSAHSRTSGLLDDEPSGPAAGGTSGSARPTPEQDAEPMTGETAEAPVGSVVGAYRISSEIGRGGMGVVYLAERADGQFKQRVSLKMIRRGPETTEPSEHRRPPGWRSGRGWPTVPGHGVRRGRPDRRVLRSEPARDQTPAEALLHRGACRPACAPQPRGSQGSQAFQHPGHARGPREAAGLRDREDPRPDVHGGRCSGNSHRTPTHDARVREPGAGKGRARHDSHRCVCAGGGALRAAHRATAVPADRPHAGRSRANHHGGGTGTTERSGQPVHGDTGRLGRTRRGGRGRSEEADRPDQSRARHRAAAAASRAEGRHGPDRSHGAAQGTGAPIRVGRADGGGCGTLSGWPAGHRPGRLGRLPHGQVRRPPQGRRGRSGHGGGRPDRGRGLGHDRDGARHSRRGRRQDRGRDVAAGLGLSGGALRGLGSGRGARELDHGTRDPRPGSRSRHHGSERSTAHPGATPPHHRRCLPETRAVRGRGRAARALAGDPSSRARRGPSRCRGEPAGAGHGVRQPSPIRRGR